MKYQQQVSVDLMNMVYTAIAYLALAGAAWLLLRLVQACFWLPRHMRRQNEVQVMLQDKVDSYERFVLECEAKEAAESSNNSGTDGVIDEKEQQAVESRRKERRECLDMLKRELQRIRDGGDPYDFDHLLDEDEKRLLFDGEEEEEPTDIERKPTDDLQNEKEKAEEQSEAPEDTEDEPKKDK